MTDSLDPAYELVHRSPPLSLLAGVFVALFLASVGATFLMTGGAAYPIPYKPIDQLQDYYTRFPDVMRVVAFLQFGASIPLGLFTATVVSRLLFHRITVAGVHIALFGGIAASLFMGISALATWTLSQPGVASDAGAMRVASLLAFATGGFGHTAALGLLLAGVSVPALAFGIMPRWAAWFGLIVAVIAEVSSISMLVTAASPLLPLARFPALVWLLVAGFTIPKARVETQSSGSGIQRTRRAG
jgi:hypothetical protein